MDELLNLIRQYDPYYEMSDDGAAWRRGSSIDQQIRALVQRLRAEGYGPEIDALLTEYPHLVSSPYLRLRTVEGERPAVDQSRQVGATTQRPISTSQNFFPSS